MISSFHRSPFYKPFSKPFSQSPSPPVSSSNLRILIGIVFVVVIGIIIYLSTRPTPAPTKSISTPASTSTKPTVVASNLGFSMPETKEQLLVSSDDQGNLQNTALPVDEVCPIGTIMIWSTTTAPKGWLLCDGSEYPSSDDKYKKLFEVIKTTYGGASDKFKVPDLRGRVVVGVGLQPGKDANGGDFTNRELAKSGGAENHTLSIHQMPKHTHKSLDHWQGDDMSDNADDRIVASYNEMSEWRETTSAGGDEKLGGNTAPHNNMQPYLVLNYIIKY